MLVDACALNLYNTVKFIFRGKRYVIWEPMGFHRRSCNNRNSAKNPWRIYRKEKTKNHQWTICRIKKEEKARWLNLAFFMYAWSSYTRVTRGTGCPAAILAGFLTISIIAIFSMVEPRTDFIKQFKHHTFITIRPSRTLTAITRLTMKFHRVKTFLHRLKAIGIDNPINSSRKAGKED